MLGVWLSRSKQFTADLYFQLDDRPGCQKSDREEDVHRKYGRELVVNETLMENCE